MADSSALLLNELQLEKDSKFFLALVFRTAIFYATQHTSATAKANAIGHRRFRH